MISMTSDDILFGLDQSLRPFPSFLKELVENGSAIEEIERYLDEGGSDEESYHPIQAYVGARGYSYVWGHIMQDISCSKEDGEIFHFASWNFCFDGFLSEFHSKGLCLEDLSCLSVYLLLTKDLRPGYIPSYINLGHGNVASAFELFVYGCGEDGLEQIRNAREWIAICFLDPILTKLIDKIEKYLAVRS